MSSSPTNWLVLTDVDAVQSYLFSSVRLAVIAGASQIVADFDNRLAELARQCGGDPLIHAGGIGAVLFDAGNFEGARTFAHRAEARFRDESVSGHLTASAPFPVPSGSLAEVQAAVLAGRRELRHRKNLGHSSGEVITHPLAQRCESCGREPATAFRAKGPRQWLGPSCARKLERRRRAADGRRRRESWLRLLRLQPGTSTPDENWNDLRSRHLARDFDMLAGDGDLGLIVADGDGIGRVLDQLAPGEQWTRFSKGLEGLLNRSLGDALRSVLDPYRNDVLNEKIRLPIQVLFRGGDDIVIACRGDLALPLASHLVQQVSNYSDWSWSPKQKHLGLSAAVVVTRVGFPFRTAHEIAEGLLREAKRTGLEEGWRAEGQGAVDYAVISESFGDLDVIMAQRFAGTSRRPRSIAFTGRPFRAATRGERSIGGLERACRILDQARFPRSRLFDLRRELTGESFSAEAPSGLEPSEVESALKRLRGWLANWTSRTIRTPELEAAWETVLAALELGPDGWYRSSELPRVTAKTPVPLRVTTDRTPLADLGDAMAMWGFKR